MRLSYAATGSFLPPYPPEHLQGVHVRAETPIEFESSLVHDFLVLQEFVLASKHDNRPTQSN
jgi:hypothetical protein